jgi:hypothetical protein
MAAEPRNVSGGAGWSKSDIVELVALLLGVPAAIAAVFMLVTYYRRKVQGTKGKTLFPRDNRPQRPLEVSPASHTGYLPPLLCDSCCALQARPSNETAIPTTSVGSKHVCSCAWNCTSKLQAGSANP